MIYTITISPAIDYVVHLDELVNGVTNRSTRESYFYGGKGINVSRVLKEMDVKSKALGFVGGFTGKELETGLSEIGICTDFIHLKKGNTRINVKIKCKEETEINCQGAIPDDEEMGQLFTKLQKLKEDDVLVLSGSIPKALPQDTYNRLLSSIDGRGVHSVVDATGQLLLGALEFKPFLIKPNTDELKELFGEEITPEEGAKRLQEKGAKNVIVSMGKDGAILLAEDGKFYRSGVCKGTMKNTVGAGDSMVAGFVTGYLHTKDYQYALDLGSAAGSATALSPGLATGKEIKDCLAILRKDRIKR